MQRATLGVAEVVTFVVGNEVDNRTLGKGGWLVKNEPPLFDTRSERAHGATVGVSGVPGKRAHGKRSPRLGEAVTLSGSGRRPQRVTHEQVGDHWPPAALTTVASGSMPPCR